MLARRSDGTPLATTTVTEATDQARTSQSKGSQPLTINGMTLDKVFSGAALTLAKRGELDAALLAQELSARHETVEYRTLLRLREAPRNGNRGGKR